MNKSKSNSPESKRFESFDQLIEPVDPASQSVIKASIEQAIEPVILPVIIATNEAANEPVIEVIDLTTRHTSELGSLFY